jgi:hypothetical protein
MNLNSKKFVIVALILLVLAIVALVVKFGAKTVDNIPAENSAPVDEPLDVVIDFYNQWLSQVQSTTTNPFDSGLINSTRLSDGVRTVINEKRSTKIEGDLDAVLCQSSVPERVGGKEIYKTDTKSQVMILARGFETKSPYQAIVDTEVIEGNWQITKIECLQSEVAPVSEFDFERQGFLLKSVVPPLNPEYWHLVYEENGILGHAIPLFFNAESICVSSDGTEAVCDPSKFVETTKVLIQAAMLDTGADVKRLTIQ